MRDDFKQLDIYEFAPYHVGWTHLHERLDTDEYFAVRAKEDLQSYREWQSYAPSVEQSTRVANMEDLYRTFTQHKWLPLQTAWPFNLRMVTFVLMSTHESQTGIVADKLVKRIRTWGCPVSPYGDGYKEWQASNYRDVVFNRFSEIARDHGERHRLVKDLFLIGDAIQDDRWLPRRPRWWNRRKSERRLPRTIGACLGEAEVLVPLESFDNPSEYVPHHVGRTQLHQCLGIDQYFTARVKEDHRALRQQFKRWPGAKERSLAPNLMEASRIMEDLYRTYTQHKWLPLPTAWPFNLRMVTFVLMHAEDSDAMVADKLIQRIRSWGCPISPFADGHDAWIKNNNRDVMFNLFRDIKARPSPKYQSAVSPVTRDLDRIAAMIRAGR